jgi:hypothetical protein
MFSEHAKRVPGPSEENRPVVALRSVDSRGNAADGAAGLPF